MYPHAAGALFCLPQDWMFQQHAVPGNTSRVLKNYKNVLFIFYLVTNKPAPPQKKKNQFCLFASDAAKPLKHTQTILKRLNKDFKGIQKNNDGELILPRR